MSQVVDAGIWELPNSAASSLLKVGMINHLILLCTLHKAYQ